MDGGTLHQWPSPTPGRPDATEYAFGYRRRPAMACVLIVPALFEEANRTRRMLVETIRALDRHGVDAVLPDLPGCNESPADFTTQTLDSWRQAMNAAAEHFSATHVIALRGGALVASQGLPGWALEPAKGAVLLRQLLRARVIASREAGREERIEDLIVEGRAQGLELAGYRFGAALVSELETALPAPHLAPIALADIGGAALWLRSEPGEDTAQSDALAARIVADLSA